MEPNTVNKALIVPLTGDLPGAWGTAALNPDFQAIDGMFGGFTTISVAASTTVVLGLPQQLLSGGSLTPGAGPCQSQNALIKFTGTLTGNSVFQFTLPGFYIIHNLCTVSSFYIQLAPASGTGNAIGAPPGRKCHVFFDGTSMDYINMPDPATAVDLQGYTALPSWMTACTVLPYLIKDGSTYSSSIYPALSAALGSTFGGNGITTFGVPDELSRARIAIDTGTNGGYRNRLTALGSGVNGTTMGAVGGNELLQTHNHTLTDPGHFHSPNSGGVFITTGNQFFLGNSNAVVTVNASSSTTTTATTGITLGAAGSGTSQNVQPSIVSFLPLIKT